MSRSDQTLQQRYPLQRQLLQLAQETFKTENCIQFFIYDKFSYLLKGGTTTDTTTTSSYSSTSASGESTTRPSGTNPQV